MSGTLTAPVAKVYTFEKNGERSDEIVDLSHPACIAVYDDPNPCPDGSVVVATETLTGEALEHRMYDSFAHCAGCHKQIETQP